MFTILKNNLSNHGIGHTAITNFNIYSTRNNFSGLTGFTFRPSKDISVKKLGRYFINGGGTNITPVRLYGRTQYKWTQITSVTTIYVSNGYSREFPADWAGITLVPNKTYFLASYETNGGNLWYDVSPVTSTTNTTNVRAAYCEDPVTLPIEPGFANAAYVNNDIWWPAFPHYASIVVNFSGVPQRNDFTGWVGHLFQVQSAASPRLMGRYYIGGGGTAPRTTSLWSNDLINYWSTSSIVTADASYVGGAFSYTDVIPTTLLSGSEYFIATSETNGGNLWYESTLVTPDTYITQLTSAWAYEPFTAPNYWTAGESYVPVNFKFD